MQILRFAQHGTDGNVSDDFFQAHLGRATASSASNILDFTQKGVEGSKRKLYRLEKVAEILAAPAAEFPADLGAEFDAIIAAAAKEAAAV